MCLNKHKKLGGQQKSMIQKIIHRMLERRHYWRTVGFSELAELYANRLLRLMAVNMFSGVVGIYLYQIGYPIWQIAVIFGVYFLVRAASAIPSAYFIGRIGPKHGTLVSNFLYIPSLLALTQLEHLGFWALLVFCTLQPFAVALYTISYHVGFSKVKHSDHVGKEISFMYIVEKIGAGISPIVGGFIAYIFGPEVAIAFACVLFVISAAPLFFSPEPVMTHQHIIFRGFNWRATWRNLASALSLGADWAMSAGLWSIFVAVAVFGTTSNVVYAQVGTLLSIGLVASLVFSRLYGLVVDHRRGGELLRAAVAGNSLLHIARAFVSTPLGVVLVNIGNEAATTGYSMPYLKGQYDMADSLPGYRIVYLALMEVAVGIGAGLMAFCVALLSFHLGDIRGLQVGYILAAVAVLPIMSHGFPALRRLRIAKP